MIATFIGGPIDGRVQAVQDAPYTLIVLGAPSPVRGMDRAPSDRMETLRYRYEITAVAGDDVAYRFVGVMRG